MIRHCFYHPFALALSLLIGRFPLAPIWSDREAVEEKSEAHPITFSAHTDQSMKHHHKDEAASALHTPSGRWWILQIFPTGNGSYIAYARPDRPATNDSASPISPHDPQGAVMYVVIVVFLWGLSIVLLIASYVRKNQSDRSISLYLEEIKVVRKQSRRQNLIKVVHSIDSRGWCPDLNQRSRMPLLEPPPSPRPFFFNFHKSRSSGFRGEYEMRDDEAASQWSLASEEENISPSPSANDGGRSEEGLRQISNTA